MYESLQLSQRKEVQVILIIQGNYNFPCKSKSIVLVAQELQNNDFITFGLSIEISIFYQIKSFILPNFAMYTDISINRPFCL